MVLQAASGYAESKDMKLASMTAFTNMQGQSASKIKLNPMDVKALVMISADRFVKACKRP